MRKDMCLGFTERIEEVTLILWERILRVMAVNLFFFSRGNDQGSRVGRLPSFEPQETTLSQYVTL